MGDSEKEKEKLRAYYLEVISRGSSTRPSERQSDAAPLPTNTEKSTRRVRFDAKGNPVWKWDILNEHDPTADTIDLAKALDNEILAVENETGTNRPGAGFDPYNKTKPEK